MTDQNHKCGNSHTWTMLIDADPDYGTPCNCGKKQWGVPSPRVVRAEITQTSPLDLAFSDVRTELLKATAKFPTWPTDPLHALAILGEEFGELTKAVVQQTYEPHKNQPGEVHKEAIQCAAMAMRFVLSLQVYIFTQSSGQHVQPGGDQP